MAIQTLLLHSHHQHQHQHQHLHNQHPTHPPPDSRAPPPDGDSHGHAQWHPCNHTHRRQHEHGHKRVYPCFRIARVDDGLPAHRPGSTQPLYLASIHEFRSLPRMARAPIPRSTSSCYLMCDISFQRYCNEPILERLRHRLFHGSRATYR
ncbi:hypothetical protein BC826DRAFT_602227 [Russula brevipes]|nr:hypothetical protein BC826DRAFT_602227 [Russula brevipes]